MRALIGAKICLPSMPTRMLGGLIEAMTFDNPEFAQKLRLGLHTGATSRSLCYVEQLRDGSVQVPRGAIRILKGVVASHGERLECDDKRVWPGETLANLPDLPLRDYQQRAVDRLAALTQGTVIVPCGGGKTRIGLGTIARLRTPTIVLVHTHDLAEQWRAELSSKLAIEAGLIGGGKTEPRDVTVALIQSLQRMGKTDLTQLLERFGLLILDEAHHVAASTFAEVVDLSPSRYRVGLTATPERADGLTAVLELYLGAPAVVVTHDELITAGVLAVPTLRVVQTEFRYPYHDSDDYAAMLSAVADDAERNALVIDTIAAEAREGHSCLALSGRVDHCEQIASALEARGIRSAALTGQVAKKRRNELLDAAKSGDIQVLCATSLADEGLDMPRLSRLFLTFPGRAKSRTIQRIGRLMRPHPDKGAATLIDFVDSRVPILKWQHQERRRAFAEVTGSHAKPQPGRH